jgi:hypothetical protein
MTDESVKLFSREFKLAALGRMAAGENVSALARELGIARKYLYQWRDRLRVGGPVALRTRGRPTKAEAVEIQGYGAVAVGVAVPDVEVPAPSGLVVPVPPSVEAKDASRRTAKPEPPDALARAQRRIAELERKIGQQQVDLDFFQRALRQVRELRQHSGVPGGTASTRSSKR